MTSTTTRGEAIAWTAAGLVLVGLAIPWFLWGDDRLAYGLPVWVWWHVVWMLVASVTFYVFAQRAWGIGVEGVRRG